MARSIFLTVILASAILAYVQANPVPDNSSKRLVISKELLEPEKTELQEHLKNVWTNVKNVLKENYKELKKNSSLSNTFLNTVDTFIDQIELSIDESFEGSNKNSEPPKNDLVNSWNKYQETVTKRYEERQNSKVQAIVNEIETAIRTTKTATQRTIDNTCARIENVEKNNDKEIVIEYEDDDLRIKDKVPQGWNNFKQYVKEKYEKFMNNPKVKDIIEKTNKMMEETKNMMKNIIESVRKEINRPQNSEDRETPNFKEKSQETWEDFKNKLEKKYKEMLNDSKVKEVMEKTDKSNENTEDLMNRITDSDNAETDTISKTENSDEKEENSTTLGMKEKTKKVWDDLKKKIEDKRKEILDPKIKKALEKIKKTKDSIKEIIESINNRIKKGSKPQNSEEEQENSRTLRLKDKAKKALNDLKKILDEFLNNPKVKEIIEAIKKNIPKPPKTQPRDDPNSTQTELDNFKDEEELKNEEDDTESVMRKNRKESWADFKKKVEKKIKEILNNDKMKEIIEAVKKIIDRRPKPENSDEVEKHSEENSGFEENLEENSEALGLKDKAQQAWDNFKNEFKKILNNPKIKKIIEEGERAVRQAKESVPEIIDSIRNQIKQIEK
ncbi:kinetochore protein ndc-80-like [Vespula squamosa]|uniref:Kinetochore protein ndc-80-like n=1 Tax=Vespula squamosa TaxID=30214 RepID=A0ABD2A3P2_VESSQ